MILRSGRRLGFGPGAAAIGGLDALVFTGGIGENSTWLRSEVCRGLPFLGVRLNADCHPDADVATDDSPVRVSVIHTREDLMIARESRRLILESESRSAGGHGAPAG